MSAHKQIVCPHCQALNRVPDERLRDSPRCGNCHAELLDGKPLESTSASFDRHLKRNDLPMLVDFWAPWCGPCRIMAPVFAQLAQEFATQARFVKVNTEQETMLAGRYGIRSIPTLILFKDGREVDRLSGALNAQGLRAWLQAQQII